METLDLKSVRVELNMTQAQFADRAGVNRKTILAYEKDPTKIPESKRKFLLIVIDALRAEMRLPQSKTEKKSPLHIIKTDEEIIVANIVKKLKPLLTLLIEKTDRLDKKVEGIDGQFKSYNCSLEGILSLLQIDKETKG